MPEQQESTSHGAQTPTADAGANNPNAVLARVIEGEILPRLLMLNRRGVAADAPGAACGAAGPGEVAELARLLIDHGASVATAFVDTISARGAPRNRICLDLLAPAARRIEALWEQQQCDYSQLVRGLNALHAVLLEVRGRGEYDSQGSNLLE